MNWIKSFTKGTFTLFSGNIVEGFQPLDFFHFYPLWFDLWTKRIVEMMRILDLENKPFNEIKEFLPTPSNMRAILQKLVPSYHGLKQKNPVEYKIVTNFFARLLQECCPDDPFGETSNPYYSAQEVKKIGDNIPWREGNPQIARQIGCLITTTGSLVHGLYNDVVTDFGWDAYGPFSYDGKTLLIRHFPNLRPKELWPEQFLSSVKELQIYGLYENVDWKIGCVGCHTIVTKGSPITGLKKYHVIADGVALSAEKIDELINELSNKAEGVYREIRKKNFEELKKMVVLQECFQLKKLFDAAGLDWKPTPKMIARVKNKPLLTGLIPHGVMMSSLEEYRKAFGIDVFAKEVLNAQP